MIRDVKKIFENLNPVIPNRTNVKGETNVKFPVAAIEANFKISKDCNIDSDEAYKLTGNLQCKIESKRFTDKLMPYRDGSKVTYDFGLPCTFNGKGESSYTPELGKKIVATLEKLVKD